MATTNRTCTFSGCGRISTIRGLCKAHNLQLHRGSGLKPIRIPKSGCRAEDCQAPHYARGLCRKHDTQFTRVPWRANGRYRCSVDGCDRESSLYGMCTLHSQRMKRHGDPLKVLLPMGSGENITNSAAHARVKAIHGPARNHPCVDCGGSAAHWSYDHADPNEKQSPDGPYSPDPEHYNARCVPCHKLFDLKYIENGEQPWVGTRNWMVR